jgi:segregation and condensation protein A
MFDEQNLIKNIFSGMDWQEILEEIVISEGMDPWEVDIVKLTDTFMSYLQTMQKFDFKIPGRFILIAAILLRMKCEILFEEEEEKETKKEEIPPIDISQIPQLSPPMMRVPSRKV